MMKWHLDKISERVKLWFALQGIEWNEQVYA